MFAQLALMTSVALATAPESNRVRAGVDLVGGIAVLPYIGYERSFSLGTAGRSLLVGGRVNLLGASPELGLRFADTRSTNVELFFGARCGFFASFIGWPPRGGPLMAVTYSASFGFDHRYTRSTWFSMALVLSGATALNTYWLAAGSFVPGVGLELALRF